MKLTTIISDLIHLPSTLNSFRDISAFTLVKNSGYFELYNQISSQDIQKALAGEPQHIIKEWLSYSENQRTNPSYYFEQNASGYIVGYLDITNRTNFTVQYTDPLEACANFIKNEMDLLRSGFISKGTDK